MPDQAVEKNYAAVLKNIKKAAEFANRKANSVTLVAVSKTFQADEIKPVLQASHRAFGENRVQEAEKKWPDLRREYDNIELHLIGPLQSNKAAAAVALFDVIQTIDRIKIAVAIGEEMKKQNRKVRLLVQVNTGSEPQKAGIAPEDTVKFVRQCQGDHGLEIEGLMCIPPADENPGPHFALLRKLGSELGLPMLSMGMSADYETAIEMGATHVRVGSAIFGQR
jgi:pyridoxal phosphate enzyme (YggS family)